MRRLSITPGAVIHSPLFPFTFFIPDSFLVVKVTLEGEDPRRQTSLFGSTSQSVMADATPTLRDQAPDIPTKDLIFEVRFFKSHYLLRQFTRGKLGEEIWVSIGGDYIRLPDNLGATLFDDNGPPHLSDPSEELRHPQLYDPSTEWVGYVPDAIAWYLDHPDDDIFWAFQYYTDVDHLLEGDEDKEKISDALIDEISGDLKEARELVCRLEERGGLPLTMVDSGYRPWWLRDCEGMTACRYGLYKARECLLNLLGAISWGLSHVDESSKGLLTRTRAAELRRWLVNDAPRLGFVVDPRSPSLDVLPLLELRKNGCPLYFPWSYQWRPEQSDAELDALAGVDKNNFSLAVERSCSCKSPLLDIVRAGPPAFPGAILESRISMENAEVNPPRSLREEYEARELALKHLQDDAEKALGNEFTHTRPTHFIWGYAHQRNLPRDAIIIISPVNEVRMRLWDLWMRCANPAQVVLEAIARGMAVRLVYRLDSKTAEDSLRAHEPHTPPIPPRTLEGTHVWYWETWEEFLTIAKELLSRPDAIAYVMMGGIVARIALWLGPPDLIDKLTQGPSSLAALYTTDLHPTQHYLADAADPENVKALSGIVEDPRDGTLRSWFPTQENLEYCGFWRGEWTFTHEAWFLTRVTCIRERTEQAKPLTAHQWSTQLKRRRVRWLDQHLPKDEEIQAVASKFANYTGGSWNGATLAEMETRFGACRIVLVSLRSSIENIISFSSPHRSPCQNGEGLRTEGFRGLYLLQDEYYGTPLFPASSPGYSVDTQKLVTPAVGHTPDGQYIAYDGNIASLSTAIPSMLQHHKDSLRTVGAPEPESHYSVCYCDGQVVITGSYIWDITKHERRYSCGNEIGEMSSAFPVKDDIILSCNQYGDVTLWDPSRAQPVIKRWEGCISHGGRHPKLHVYSCTASTIRFLSYSYTGPVGITLQLWAITNLDTLSLPHRYTAGDSGPRLHQIAAGQIQMKSEPSIDAVYHEYLADSNGEEAVFYLECGRRYRGVHKWSAAQATVSEPLVKEDGSGPVHIDFKEIPYVWEDELAEYPIASDGLFLFIACSKATREQKYRCIQGLAPEKAQLAVDLFACIKSGVSIQLSTSKSMRVVARKCIITLITVTDIGHSSLVKSTYKRSKSVLYAVAGHSESRDRLSQMNCQWAAHCGTVYIRK
ncbi:hypothetical protein BC629DRAFT_1615402 [Irpex lacteus]|nr:hypothetical protein BC629DRAFT_1615402 [Irpex lacteus]